MKQPLADSRRLMAMRAGSVARVERISHAVQTLVIYGVATMFLALTMFPVFWTWRDSLKDIAEIFQYPPTAFPARPLWGNYVEVFVKVPYGLWVANSATVAVLATIGTVISATLVAYSFARFNYPGRDVFFSITLATLILPVEVTIVPAYLFFRSLGWLNTFLPLIVPHWLGGGAFYIFLLRQFLLTVPRDFDEAAKVDGADSLRILVSAHSFPETCIGDSGNHIADS